MTGLPTGTVTFLFADIEGSTRLLQHLGDRYANVLTECLHLVRTACEERDGREVSSQGDALFIAFRGARDAVAAAVSAQRALAVHSWPEDAQVHVRMGIHTGEALTTDAGYVGMDVHVAARICAAAHGGQILLSQATGALAVRELPAEVTLRDMGDHRLKDLAKSERLFQAVVHGLRTDFPPLKSLDTLPNNLPRQLTRFIGREREVADLKNLLSRTSLVTLTGAGGSGKTRLALQVAADLLDQYPDGVWLAELAPLTVPALVPKAVASALGVIEQPHRPLSETLADHLRSRALLLVLDNCEHLLDACVELVDGLLQRCPHVRILSTSRESLGMTGEVTYRVPSLSVPGAGRLPPLDRLMLYEAVQLFVERAAASNPAFRLTNDNAAAVVQMCSRLDGIPLALELAAARVNVLTVEQLASRLDNRFALLTRGSRAALPRHQTLRAAMDWSYDLLSQNERTVLCRLSVFVGGWALEAAESVCSGDGIEEHEVLDILTHLVAKSLVNAETLGGEVRHRMLETVRQYGGERLLALGEAATLRRRHRDWYLALAERAAERIVGPEQSMWLNRLELEHDNLRAALDWKTGEPEETEPRLRLAGALVRFWDYHTHWAEARTWLESALAGSPDARSTARAAALAGAGFMAFRQRDYEGAMAFYEESLALAQELGDQKDMVMAQVGRGLITMYQGDLDAAIALFAESLDLAEKLEEPWLIAVALAQLGVVYRWNADHANAVKFSERSLATYREVGGKRGIAYALRLTGHSVRLSGDLKRARGLYQESLALYRDTGDKWVATECIEGLAIIAGTEGDRQLAARLSGMVEAARETFGITMPRLRRGTEEWLGAMGLEELRSGVYAAAWAEGRAMNLEQAVEYTLKNA